MSQTFESSQAEQSDFVDRRHQETDQDTQGIERRQFQDARTYNNKDVQELAEAVDQYKMRHRRRFITFEELYDVVVGLGYHK